MNPEQTVTIVLYYYSERKYEGSYERKSHVASHDPAEHPAVPIKAVPTEQNLPLLKVYNHQRCITLSVLNSATSSLIHLYKLNIVPQPDTVSYLSSLVRKSNSKAVLQIPYLPSENFVVYIDDPTVVSTLN